MISSRIKGLFALALGAFLLAAMPAGAQTAPEKEQRYYDFDKMKPDATLELKAKSFKLLLGGSWGSGTLKYKGKTYKFDAKAIQAGGVAMSEVEATGEVYFLKKVEDINGVFSGGGASATAGEGKAATTLENNAGTVIRLRGKTSGLSLGPALGGVEIKLVH